MNRVSPIKKIQQGHHGCFFYDNADDLHAIAVSFVKIGLDRNERCVYLSDPLTLTAFTAALQAAGIDIGKEVQRGRLILTSERNHLVEGQFDAQRMIQFLDQGLQAALREGFQGLRATGDVVWELGTDVDMKKLADYEILLDRFFEGKKLTGLCQYNRKVISEEFLRRALQSHNAVVLGEKVCVQNPFHNSGEGISQSFEKMCGQLSAV